MSDISRQRSEAFLKISSQFKLGALVTESSHPITACLSEVAAADIAGGLALLFQADGDVVKKYREFVQSGAAAGIAAAILQALRNGGKIFFTGCGSTGRLSILLDSIWRDFWHKTRQADWENRTFSVMAGGDFALIKSVEGFEDFTAFGAKQINDLSLAARDIVFAITEGGETSFVIGTAWAGVQAQAKVYFVYNNPDAILCEQVQRSREVIEDVRIEKINLTTGPMSITGSTRMQATSIQLAVMLTVLEMVVRELAAESGGDPASGALSAAAVPREMLSQLESLHRELLQPEFLASLADIVALEESVYRSGHKNNYFADELGADVLTDTTERSPTYCTPPFRKFDDTTATESWAYLFLPAPDAPSAWRSILKRVPRCVEWSDAEIQALVDPEKFPRTREIVRKISLPELLRFRIGADGVPQRRPGPGDSAIAVVSEVELAGFSQSAGLPPADSPEPRGGSFQQAQLAAAQAAGARTAVIYFLPPEKAALLPNRTLMKEVRITLPTSNFLLRGITRVAVKLVMNALSTCTMVCLGRVMGNYMVWVVPSNLKLIDRATRYISKLTGLDYESANALLFEVIEYVEPRMKSDQAYPPVVGMAVLRARQQLSNEAAERLLQPQ
ncbi:MAG: hypothetical protein WCS94_18745 [Verrucomicrobiota bacterium]